MPITHLNRFECSHCKWEGSDQGVKIIPAHAYYEVDENEFPDGEIVHACPICGRKAIDHAID